MPEGHVNKTVYVWYNRRHYGGLRDNQLINNDFQSENTKEDQMGARLTLKLADGFGFRLSFPAVGAQAS